MLKRKADPEYAILSLDPGAKFAGVALWYKGAFVDSETVYNMRFDQCHVTSRLASLMVAWPDLRLLIVSEYPTAGAPGAPQVRQAANVAIAQFKQSFPRRVKVVKVVPQTWQSRVTKGLPGKTAKDRSIARASLDFKIESSYLEKHTDIADALNILTYARGFVTWSDGK